MLFYLLEAVPLSWYPTSFGNFLALKLVCVMQQGERSVNH